MSDPGSHTWREILEINMHFLLIQFLLILGGIKQFKAFLSLYFISVISVQWEVFSLLGSGVGIGAPALHPNPILCSLWYSFLASLFQWSWRINKKFRCYIFTLPQLFQNHSFPFPSNLSRKMLIFTEISNSNPLLLRRFATNNLSFANGFFWNYNLRHFTFLF